MVISGASYPMHIALLEDDIDQAALMSEWLRGAGHTVSHYSDAEAFLRATHHETFDLYILDWLLPKSSGIGVLKQLRARDPQGPPALFVTVRDEEGCIVEALQAGADDYMIKPVRRGETLARVDALLRRRVRADAETISVPPYAFDLEQHQMTMSGEPLQLTTREFELALFLFGRLGQIVSRQHLLESVWGTGHSAMNTRTVDTHISRLRKKLRLSEAAGWKLASIYQHGYRLEHAGPSDSVTIEKTQAQG
jgi:DNA-binding response OmpR family regulator